MPATIAQARDQMLSLLKTAVESSAHAALVLLWDDVDSKVPDPSPPSPWARVKINHTTGRKASLSNPVGKNRWERGGFVIVQLFTAGGQGNRVTDEIVSIILGAYEGKTTSGGVVFNNARFSEVGQDGPWHQTNIFVDFSYDEVK